MRESAAVRVNETFAACRRRISDMRSFLASSAVASLAAALVLLPVQGLAAQSPRPTNAEILFRLANACPATGQTQGPCTGYVVDRVIPIVCGGEEDPSIMQWQTLAEAKEKDRWEKIGCRKGRKLVLPGISASVTEAFALGDLPAGVHAQPLPMNATSPAEPARENTTPEDEVEP